MAKSSRASLKERPLTFALQCTIIGIYMEDKHRVVGEKIVINESEVKSFFDRRCEKKLPYLYNYVNYQDKHPELALERDRYEKDKILPLLQLRKGSRVLDIGCGVARWATEGVMGTITAEGAYVGVDYTRGLLDMARKNTAAYPNCRFFCGSFQDIRSVLPQDLLDTRFDVILVNGVMMYINDEDIAACLGNVSSLLADGGIAYLKESVGFTERLTLNETYSDELTSTYSAIYRSIAEYDAFFARFFPADSFTVVERDDMWKWNLHNRRETTAYYWIIRKNGVS